MSEKTIPVPENVQIVVRARADLNLQGWEKPEIRALGHSRRGVSSQIEGAIVTILCGDDCNLNVPASARVVVERVGGDAHMRGLTGGLTVQKVGGDLSVQTTRALEILSTGGDCFVYGVEAPLDIQRVGGDLVGGEIQGPVSVSHVGGDVRLQLGVSDASLNGRSDVTLAVAGLTGQKITINAGSDVELHLPQQVDADVSLVSGGDIDIHVGGLNEEEEHVYTRKFGAGGARITVRAGGDIRLTEDEWFKDELSDAVDELKDHWTEAEEQATRRESRPEGEPSASGRFGFYREGPEVIINTEELTREINRQVADKLRMAQDQVDDAMRRIEERARKKGVIGFVYTGKVKRPERPTPPNSPDEPLPPSPEPAPAAPETRPNEKVSEQERLLILKMLQDKTITAEEAEKLLEALEG